MQASDDPEYDIEKETAVSRQMLAERIPARLNNVRRRLVDSPQGFDPWRLTVAVDLVQSVDHNCAQMLETIGNDRLPAAAKAAWTDKVGLYQLCLAMDRTAAAYRSSLKAAEKDVPVPVATAPCADAGPYMSTITPAAPKPLEASGAHSAPAMAVPPVFYNKQLYV